MNAYRGRINYSLVMVCLLMVTFVVLGCGDEVSTTKLVEMEITDPTDGMLMDSTNLLYNNSGICLAPANDGKDEAGKNEIPTPMACLTDPCDTILEQAKAKEKKANELRQEAAVLEELEKEARKGHGPKAVDERADKVKKDAEGKASVLDADARKDKERAAKFAEEKKRKKAQQYREEAEGHEAAAQGIRDEGKRAANALREKAQKMRDNGVPDNPKEILGAANKLKEKADQNIANAKLLDTQAKALRKEYTECLKQQAENLKKGIGKPK